MIISELSLCECILQHVTGQQIGIGKLVVPPSKKTVTVVKSPTKILPAPPASAHKTQKVVIRQGSGLKPGTLVASTSAGHPPGTHMIRIPASQTIQQILPSGSKQVSVQNALELVKVFQCLVLVRSLPKMSHSSESILSLSLAPPI